ncbi:hypothetical protein ACFFRR_006738 [Megaselia abdita]
MKNIVIVAYCYLSAFVIVDSSKGDQYYNNPMFREDEEYLFQFPPILKNESIWELHRIGEEIRDLVEQSANKSRFPCDSFFNYVCGDNSLISSVLGSTPRIKDLVIMFNALRNDDTIFYDGAKNKLINFYKSCSRKKSVDDCHVESFEHFKPLYGFIIARKFITDGDKETLRDILEKFLRRARGDGFLRSDGSLVCLEHLYRQLIDPNINFIPYKIDDVYRNLTIYPESYKHNIRNLERFHERQWYYIPCNSYATYSKNILDFTIYLFHSRNKPRSFYYATLNVHLWMVLFTNSIKYHEGMKYRVTADCYKLPSYINILDNARNLTVIYHKSLISAWEEYMMWKEHGTGEYDIKTIEVFNKENEILLPYGLSNEHLFYIYYTQNFCVFGQLFGDNVFLQGLKHNIKFIELYKCGVRLNMNPHIKCDLP